MFAATYFPTQMFAPRYFPKVGGSAPVGMGGLQDLTTLGTESSFGVDPMPALGGRGST